jgi:C1A family cysteine protease
MYKLTYQFQEPDTRDFKLKTDSHPENAKLQVVAATVKNGYTILKTVTVPPPSFTVSPLPPILNQGDLGCCVANSFSFNVSKQSRLGVNLSRLCLYAICRSIDNTPLNQDDGTTIRTACQAIANYGVCQETTYPYVPTGYFTLPSLSAFSGSKKLNKFTYIFVSHDLASIKNALQMYNTPVILGIKVYSSFMNSVNGMIPMPNMNAETFLGGHCITMVGYNDATQMFMFANSWGTAWGAKGFCYIPYNYILNPQLASDFCVATFIY